MGEVTVRWATANAPATAERLLTAAERGRLADLKQEADRNRYLSAHALVRVLVADLLGIRAGQVRVVSHCVRCGGPHGPPVAGVPGGGGPVISLAHAGDLVIAAASRTPVGVDVEPLGAARPGVDDVALAPTEQAQLRDLPSGRRDDAVTAWWVRKEAVLKATRRGLDVDPRHVVVTPPWEPPRLVAWTATDAPNRMHLADVPVTADHVACVAFESAGSPEFDVAQIDLSAGAW